MNPSYNDSFGTSTQIMAADFDKKNKKRNIVIATLVIFVIGIIAVAIAVSFIGKSGNGGLIDKKEQYLNYLKNGNEDNNAGVGNEYVATSDYALMDALYLNSYQSAYFSKGIELLDAMGLDTSDSVYISQHEMLKMFFSYKTLSDLGTTGILNMYLEGGVDAINEKVNIGLDNIESTLNEYTYNYVANASGYLNSLIGVSELYVANGCSAPEKEAECAAMAEMQKMISDSDNYWNAIEKEIGDAGQFFLSSAYFIGVANEQE